MAETLVVVSKELAPTLPNITSYSEAGLASWQVALWWGILAPAGTPRDIINRLNATWVKTAALPDTVEKMRNAGFDPLTSTPEQFTEFIKTETVRWAKVIKDANIPVIE